MALAAAIRDQGRIRGAALREFLRWYVETRGDHALATVAADLSGPDAVFNESLPAFGVMTTRWYEAEAIHALLDAIALRADIDKIAREGGRLTTERTLSGVFRAAFRVMATPERYARHAQTLWRQYYDRGSFEVLPRDGGSTTVITGWDSHHELLCRINVAAAEVIYEAMGCKNVTATRTACAAHGAPACRYDVSWHQ